MSCIRFALLVLTCLAGAHSASGIHLYYPNRLVDPSFEGNQTYDGPPFIGSWEAFSGAPISTSEFTTGMPRTGAQSLELNIDLTVDTYAGTFQDVLFGDGLAGETAYFSGWHRATADAASEIRIEWRDSVSDTEVVRSPNLTPVLSTDYEEFILSDVVPAGADTARLVYAIQSFSGVQTQQVFVDDVNFNLVPEPVAVGLAALALLTVVGRHGRD